jgi:hypothetical protein
LDTSAYEKEIKVGAKIVGATKTIPTGNDLTVPMTDPRLEKLGINPASMLGGNGITESEINRRMLLLEMREKVKEETVKKEDPKVVTKVTSKKLNIVSTNNNDAEN